MAIKVMLVDDEAYIRLILRKVIERNSSFCIVSECDNMTDVLLEFHEKQPQVVFMDIEIKGSSGIDCAKIISQSAPDTRIIFATAYSEYMSNAFEVYAFDYLVKPFDLERVEHTLERIERSYKLTGKSEESEKYSLYTEKNKILIKGKESVCLFDKADIVFIERENNMSILYTTDMEKFKTSMTMGELEEKLADYGFLRSHKSYLINVSKIKSIEPYGRWTYVVKFKGIQNDALITKEKYEQIKQIYS